MWSVTNTSGTVARAIRLQPATTTGPPPMRSVSRPLIGNIIAAPIPCGASSRPASSALWPRSTW